MSGTTHSAAAASRVALGLAAAGLAALLVVLEPTALAGSASAKQHQLDQTAATSERQARAAYAKLPLAFVPNAGQTDRRVRYSAQVGGASFYFTNREAVFSFDRKEKGLALRLGFIGANPEVAIGARKRGSGNVNYLIGSDPAKWRTNLPTYHEVVYRGLWPGIDMVFRGSGGRLKYEFHIKQGADPNAIRLAYQGASGLSLDRRGNLVVRTALGTLKDSRPVSYQQTGARRAPVRSRFLLGDDGAYAFAVGNYDRRVPLIIDPGLQYSTYLGGSSDEQGRGIAVDALGSAYVTGFTASDDFPTTSGAFNPDDNRGSDAFVTKLNPAGSAPLAYSTYLGGSANDEGNGIAVDIAGSAYVTGFTASDDFPTTSGAFDPDDNAGPDAFVTKLNPAGSAPLAYSTYLGGGRGETGRGIAVDALGSAYVTGETDSIDFPTTPGAFDTGQNGFSSDAFVTKLNPNLIGSASLLYSTYLGGSSPDRGLGIAVDVAHSAYVTGSTNSSETDANPFPTTPGAFDTSYNGFRDAFVTKLNPNLIGSASLLYSTYLGGAAGFDEANGIAVDAAGSAYATGETGSTDFPTTPGAFDTGHNGNFRDAFVTKLNPNLIGSASLLYSTFLGSNGNEEGFGIAVDAAGSAYVTGQTSSHPILPFPTTPGAFDRSYNGGDFDAFVTKLNPNLSGSASLLYSTYLGGSGFDAGLGIAVDGASSAYVTGNTDSSETTFPITPAAYDPTYNGGTDAFVTKLDAIGAPTMLVLDPPGAMNPVGTSHTVTAIVTDAGGQPVPNVVVRFTVSGSVNTTDQCTTNGTGQCSITYSGPTAPGGDAITAYADTNNNEVQDTATVPPEPTGAATKTWIPATSGCPPNGGDDDEDDDGLEDNDERFLGTLLGVTDSDGDGREDGNDDSDDDGEDDEDEDDGTDDECPNDSDGDGEDDEDEDDEEDDD